MPPMSPTPPPTAVSYSPPLPSFPRPRLRHWFKMSYRKMTRYHYSVLPGYPLPTKRIYTQKGKYFQKLPPECWPHTHMHACSWWVWVWDPSLVHSSSADPHGETWDLDPDNFFLRDFFLGFFVGIGPCRLVSPPPLEWNSILPLVAVVVINT